MPSTKQARDTNLQQHSAGVFNILLDLHQELYGFSPIKKTMIICQSKVHHWSNHNLAIDDNWLLLNGVQSENSSLRKIDDRGAHQRAKNTTVADGEGTASHVFDGEFVVTGLILWSACKSGRDGFVV